MPGIVASIRPSVATKNNRNVLSAGGKGLIHIKAMKWYIGNWGRELDKTAVYKPFAYSIQSTSMVVLCIQDLYTEYFHPYKNVLTFSVNTFFIGMKVPQKYTNKEPSMHLSRG